MITFFTQEGFAPSLDDTLEPDQENVAIFAGADGLPTHVAVQRPSGRWSSKLGDWEDIEHALEALAGEFYGEIVQYMTRAIEQD